MCCDTAGLPRLPLRRSLPFPFLLLACSGNGFSAAGESAVREAWKPGELDLSPAAAWALGGSCSSDTYHQRSGAFIRGLGAMFCPYSSLRSPKGKRLRRALALPAMSTLSLLQLAVSLLVPSRVPPSLHVDLVHQTTAATIAPPAFPVELAHIYLRAKVRCRSRRSAASQAASWPCAVPSRGPATRL